jgi:hypothetical protein
MLFFLFKKIRLLITRLGVKFEASLVSYIHPEPAGNPKIKGVPKL